MYPYRRTERILDHDVDLALAERAQGFILHTPANLSPIWKRLEERMRIMGYHLKDVFAVNMALREAVLNAFQHGHRCDPRKIICLRYVVNSDEVILEVQDEGSGFLHEELPAQAGEEIRDRPWGRGLLLMWAYTNWMNFNRLGNRVTLVKQRSRD
jgi:serine/threonine-protein kinase RsbW